jgi:hypothetical protein
MNKVNYKRLEIKSGVIGLLLIGILLTFFLFVIGYLFDIDFFN